ncbi:FAD-dependent monooxygenase [Promicromonospora sukumoe]|uniref:FAD-dependent monooxygenase n=1 Tax=Promicromonospora sukumoe TaxID=88382 RepID=UPI00037315FB|nr:FAD-dependent monooxygenase [Promicromonospora sukumoe]
MTHVLVSGASVAGPALAFWLRRHGFDVTVVERAPAPRPGGQGIDVRGAARTVLDRMGITEQVRAAHTGVRGIAYLDAAGRRIMELPAEMFGHSGGVIADIEILRGDLMRIIMDAADGVEYLFDDSVTALEERPDGVDVTFERSAPRRFDLVVGADGVFSTTRRLAFDGAWRAVDSGYHRAVFTAEPAGGADTWGLDGWELLYSMPAGNGVGGRNVLLYPAHGGARGMVHFAGDPLEYDRHDIAGQKRLVAGVLAGEGWEVPRLLAAMERADDFYLDRHVKIEMPSWHRGRVALLGDACTAGSVGMGTSLALVGAYVLAGELAKADGDPAVAFPAYEATVRPYAAVNMKQLPGGARGFLPPTRFEIKARTAVMGALLRTPLASMMMGGIDKAVDQIALPDYAALAVGR